MPHILQPPHIKLSPKEAEKLKSELNISPAQLPKIKITDPALPSDAEISDIIKLERISEGKKSVYYRVVSV
jgi:DNA-directed RNA polymerase subunit H